MESHYGKQFVVQLYMTEQHPLRGATCCSGQVPSAPSQDKILRGIEDRESGKNLSRLMRIKRFNQLPTIGSNSEFYSHFTDKRTVALAISKHIRLYSSGLSE